LSEPWQGTWQNVSHFQEVKLQLIIFEQSTIVVCGAVIVSLEPMNAFTRVEAA
jgi:hypothetical protein